MITSVNYSYVDQLFELASNPAKKLEKFPKIENSYKFSSTFSNIAAGIVGIVGVIAYIFSEKIANRDLRPSISLFALSGVCLIYSFHVKKAESLEHEQLAQINALFDPLINGMHHETEEKTRCIIQTIDNEPSASKEDIKKSIDTVLAIYDGKQEPSTYSGPLKFNRRMDKKEYDLMLQSAELLEQFNLRFLSYSIPHPARLKLYRLQREAHFFLNGDKDKEHDAYVRYSCVDGVAYLVKGVRV